MKCWKCTQALPDGASTCTYCGASMNRRAPVTEAGRAMRQVYDHFGFDAVFAKNSVLVAALGDLLEDSRMLRNQIDMALSNGVAALYTRQLKEVGKPDADFYARIKKLMTEDAGLSDALAAKLVGYFDEMIGWPVPAQAAAQTAARASGNTAGSAAAQAQSAPRTEIPRPSQNTEIPRPQPTPTPKPTPKPAPQPKPPVNPLPTMPVPGRPGEGGFREKFGQLFRWVVVLTGFLGGGAMLFAGVFPLTIIGFVFGAVFYADEDIFLRKDNEESPSRHWTDSGLELSWRREIARFAVAIDGKWALVGSGDTILLPDSLLTKMNAAEGSRIVLAEIKDNKAIFRGRTKFKSRKK